MTFSFLSQSRRVIRLRSCLVFAILFLLMGTVAEAQAYCVKRNEVSLYEKPNGKEAYLAEKYTPLMGTGEKKSGFVEVKDLNGKTLWVRSKFVTTEYSCLIVKVTKSRLRTGPGTDFDASDMSEKGQPFLDHGGEDGWTQVENTDGGKAWLNLDHAWKPRSKFRMSFDPD